MPPTSPCSHRPSLKLPLSVVLVYPGSPHADILPLPNKEPSRPQNHRTNSTNRIKNIRHAHSINPSRHRKDEYRAEQVAHKRESGEGISDDLIVRIEHVRQGHGLQRTGAKVGDTERYGDVDPGPPVVQAVAEPPGSGELERDEWQEDPESVLGLVDSVVALGELDGDVVAQGSAEESTNCGPNDCERFC